VRTYRSIADQLGLRMCPDEAGDFVKGCQHTVANHDTGGTRFPPMTVHWRERRLSPSGTYRFLELAALALDDDLIGVTKQPWRRLYLTQMAIQRLARRVRVRIPLETTIETRRRLKAMLVRVPTKAPLRGRAFQWSRRS
jgi:hypothetical protein